MKQVKRCAQSLAPGERTSHSGPCDHCSISKLTSLLWPPELGLALQCGEQGDSWARPHGDPGLAAVDAGT